MSVRNFFAFIRHNIVIWLSIVLFSISIYYYYGAKQLRASFHQTNSSDFKNADTVIITKVIDGDEVQIENTANHKKTLVRLLGIKSFNPSASDLLVSQMGKLCFNYIKSNYLHKKAKLILENKKQDHRQRLLAYLIFQNKNGKFTQDLGLDLISKGFSVVYIKYPFKKEIDYLEAEYKAKTSKLGLWSNEKATARALTFKEIWRKERKN